MAQILLVGVTLLFFLLISKSIFLCPLWRHRPASTINPLFVPAPLLLHQKGHDISGAYIMWFYCALKEIQRFCNQSKEKRKYMEPLGGASIIARENIS